MLIFSRALLFLWAKAIATACFTQNRSIIHRCFFKTPNELINGKKPDISYLHVFGALCYPKNDREDIGKLGAKGDIGFFIGYSADSCAYRVYNQRTKKIMETINVSFDELSAMAFEQRRLDLTYDPSSITMQQPSEVEQRNQTLVEAARTMLIFSRAPLFLWVEVIATACFTQNRSIIHRRFNKTPYELINGRKPDISFLHVFGALCYPKNDREDIGKLGAKGDMGFFIGYSVDSCAYRIYNCRTKKIIETMNVSFDELFVMAFEQCSSKPRLQSMTFGQISSELDLTYALSKITKHQPTEGELDLLFKTMYDDYFGGQPSATVENVPPTQEPQVRQTSTASTTIADNVPIPTNLSSHATNIPITSQDVDELNPNAMIDGNTFVNPFATSSSNAAETSSSQNVDHRTCICFINHTLTNFNGLRITLWNKTKKIMETMNASFDELLAMDFKQHSSKSGLQSMTSGQISSGLDLTYAPSTITTQQPSEGELDLLFEAMYDDYIGGQPSATRRYVLPAQEPQEVDVLNQNAMVDGNTFVNPFAISSTSVSASSSS
nr:retrovirus-related Pol polyprotein from transposon TNT 1-94 [Tanacetum cinerariifolium]